jgi:ribosomal protein S18 acetylase RimI-like enzyme
MTVLINPQPSHIRPIHLERDIQPVADLVEACFADAMDAEGRAYLQNIRSAGRSVSSLYLSSLVPETTNIPFCGFVWEEDGRILGNVTLIYAKRNQQRLYFIANVSVHPDHRGRGIAKKLTERALRHVKEHQGSHVMLQVREDNPPAIHIYESLGFTEINRRTNWIVDRAKHPSDHLVDDIRISGRKSEDWPQQKAWLQDLFPETVGWFLPFNMQKHTPGLMNWLDRWLNSDVLRVWAVRSRGHLLGFGSLETVNPHQDYLWLATSPANEDATIRSLIPYVIHHTHQPNKLHVNYPAGRSVEAFTDSGMKVLNTLIWMEAILGSEPS